MKKQIPTAAFVAVVVVVLAVAVFIGWKATAPPDYSKARPPAGPIKLPPSQVGTKLGDQVLGSEIGGPTMPMQPK